MVYLELYINNNNVIELQALTNTATGLVDNGATVTVALQDADGNAVVGQDWPASMSYVSGSEGNYRATLDSDLVMTPGRIYTAVVLVSGSGSGEVARWDAEFRAKTRRTVIRHNC